MSEPTPPKIEFPCPNYPIKIMGDAGSEFRAHVIEVVGRYAEDFDPKSAKIRLSKNGRFESITVSITATGTEQLEAIFAELKKHASLRMVL